MILLKYDICIFNTHTHTHTYTHTHIYRNNDTIMHEQCWIQHKMTLVYFDIIHELSCSLDSVCNDVLDIFSFCSDCSTSQLPDTYKSKNSRNGKKREKETKENIEKLFL